MASWLKKHWHNKISSLCAAIEQTNGPQGFYNLCLIELLSLRGSVERFPLHPISTILIFINSKNQQATNKTSIGITKVFQNSQQQPIYKFSFNWPHLHFFFVGGRYTVSCRVCKWAGTLQCIYCGCSQKTVVCMSILPLGHCSSWEMKGKNNMYLLLYGQMQFSMALIFKKISRSHIKYMSCHFNFMLLILLRSLLYA